MSVTKKLKLFCSVEFLVNGQSDEVCSNGFCSHHVQLPAEVEERIYQFATNATFVEEETKLFQETKKQNQNPKESQGQLFSFSVPYPPSE